MPSTVTWIGSPHRSGRGRHRPEAIVIHIMEGSLRGTDQWFNNPESQVSAHYGIGQDGTIHQYVEERDAAWHAGRVHRSSWPLLKPGVNPNRYTIGIEHEGHADTPWSEAMYEASAGLVREIADRWSIPLDRAHVVGHREIYARKSCPGNRVDLDRLIRMARREGPRPAEEPGFVRSPGQVRTRGWLRLRRGAPSTAVRAVRTIPAGTAVEYVGWTSQGQSVNGNPVWYRDVEGNYFWAGGTDQPTPPPAPPEISVPTG